MLSKQQRIASFRELGEIFRIGAAGSHGGILQDRVREAGIKNPWFTEAFVWHALAALGDMLREDKLLKWLQGYSVPYQPPHPKTIGTIMAGNLPLVGFHDMMCVLLSGHRLLAKTSAKDEVLPALVRDLLFETEPGWKDHILLTTGKLKDFDAVIATGSDNTSRYFDYYFGRYPHIIRRNRNSLAMLTGTEEREELDLLADDIFLYFGLGCRNVSMLLVPEGYDFKPLLIACEKYKHLAGHQRFSNNYLYQKAILQMSRTPHTDAGFFLLKEDTSPASPLAVVHFKTFREVPDSTEKAGIPGEMVQCRVGKLRGWTPFGRSQQPDPDDYADGIDTMSFLLDL